TRPTSRCVGPSCESSTRRTCGCCGSSRRWRSASSGSLSRPRLGAVATTHAASPCARSPPCSSLCALTALLVSPVSWSHHWVLANHPPHSELHLDALHLIYADAYVLVAALVLALAASSAARRALAQLRLVA